MQFKKYLFAFVITIIPLLGLTQSRGGFWYFGAKAGLEFKKNNSVIPVKSGVLTTDEGCATICNKKGELLFYTDGSKVYNKKHKQMVGGSGLYGDKSATQSAVIVPKPGSTIIYYIFTVNAHENNLEHGAYSVVDMSKEGGNGAVIVKNKPLSKDKVCEKITAVKHANGVDYWIVFHLWNSDIFTAYLLTKSGVGENSVNTAIGPKYAYDAIKGGRDGMSASIGYMKASPYGDKLAAASYIDNSVELYRFNNNTGAISNHKRIKNIIGPYGVEFSPSGNLLYISSLSRKSVYQYNIKKSIKNDIHRSSFGEYCGALQIGPNGKIYVAKTNVFNVATGKYLDVIENPDKEGSACGYVVEGQGLGEGKCSLGLPNFITSIFALSFDYKTDCLGLDVDFTITSSLENVKKAQWIFGDKSKAVWGDINKDFKVSHIYDKPGSYTVKLRVELLSGGFEEIEQEVKTMRLPVANNQNPEEWEDVQGSGKATVDLSLLETKINGGKDIVCRWFTDEAKKNEISSLKSVEVTNGQQFWVTVSDGVCENTAVVTYTVKPLPTYKDIEDLGCEEVYDSGKRKVNLIDKQEEAWGTAVKVTWFKDKELTNLVQHPQAVIVKDGDVYYAKIVAKNGTMATAKIKFTVSNLPKANDIIVKVWENPFGSGTAEHVNLRTYDSSVTDKGTAVVWFDKEGNELADISDLTVADGDTFYAKMDSGTCKNSGSVQFFIRSAPVVIDLKEPLCESVLNSNKVEHVDLTLWNEKINKEKASTFKWYFDKEHKKEVPNPKDVTVNKGDIFYVVVTLKGESSSAELVFDLLTLPEGVPQKIVVFKGKTDKNVDLTAYDNAVSNNSGYPVVWYRDKELTDKINNPKSVDVKKGDVFYAKISNGSCYNAIPVTVVVKATPMANDIVENRCVNADGTTVYDDLSQLQEKINGTAGDIITWYSSWANKPKGMPANEVLDPKKVEVTEGKEYYAVVTDKNDASSTNVAVVTYHLKTLPKANNITEELWESEAGNGSAVGVNLEEFNTKITGTKNALIWLDDTKKKILTPKNVTAINGSVFYAKVEGEFGCGNEGSVKFIVKELPRTNNLTISLCEDVPDIDKAKFMLTDKLKEDISMDMENPKWYNDADEEVNGEIEVKNGDVITLKGTYKGNNLSGNIKFTVNKTPVFSNIDTIKYCEDIPNTEIKNGIDLTAITSSFSKTPGATVVWYTNKELTKVVVNPRSVTVKNNAKFYVLLTLGDCTNSGEIDFVVNTIPKYDPYTKEICSETDKKNIIHVNLKDYNKLVTGVDKVEWFNDFDLTDKIIAIENVEVIDRSAFYAKITKAPCEGRFRLNLIAKPLPKANTDTINVCEETRGAGGVNTYDLDNLKTTIFAEDDKVEWYRESTLADNSKIVNTKSYQITNDSKLYVKINGANGCENNQAINFKVHSLPKVDIGKDTTIFYTESKIFTPIIDKAHLPGKYLWQDKSVKPSLTATEQGLYKLIFTDKNGCVGEDSAWLLVDNYRIFVPNAFTPNGDGRNDGFAPLISGDLSDKKLEMYIYNRWGEKVYEFTDIGVGKNKGGTPWDGTYKGVAAKIGVYVWVLIVDGKAKKNGTITLIR